MPQGVPLIPSLQSSSPSTAPISRKRRAPTPDALREARTRKFCHPTRPPPSFWDDLPELYLERSALRELDRRNQEQIERIESRKGPVTRCAAALERLTPADEYLQDPDVLAAVKRFARVGGPDLTDLRGYYITEEASLPRRQTADMDDPLRSESSARTKSTGPYNRHFLEHLKNNSIYPPLHRFHDGTKVPKPFNIGKIQTTLQERRGSVSSVTPGFTDDDFDDFCYWQETARTEVMVFSDLKSYLDKDKENDKTTDAEIFFFNLDPITNGQITAAKPDYFCYSEKSEIDGPIVKAIGNLILPSRRYSYALPNFFIEAKGPQGNAAVAKRQAQYDGALGARAMHSLRTYLQPGSDPVYDRKAYTITVTFASGILNFYTTHIDGLDYTKNHDEPRPCYVMTKVAGFQMDIDAEQFRRGITAFRNAKRWAERQRKEAIKLANSRNRAQVGGIGGPIVLTTVQASNRQDWDDSLDSDYLPSSQDSED
ncbi:uncharacterized protein PG998_009004 [Apiospora kogelbergensis]|uniref:uncharacterized protein n=1 Tax=Apiospora kogelbergensis TaxID=1337665 RepID=UPI0031329254